MKKTFYSNGKLLITGEYTVLNGAQALALPTVFGQYLDVTPAEDTTIQWTSYDADGTIWFDEILLVEAIITNKPDTAKPELTTLVNILHEAYTLNPSILRGGYVITTRLTFPRQWGLGTSSTLINNIAQWFSIDAYTLLAKSFGGSGYDIACAQHNTPIVYQLHQGVAVVSPVSFNPVFTNNLYFVYLNQKQNSREAIAAYREHHKDISAILLRINSLTNDVLLAGDLQSLASALEKHEDLMAGVLGIQTVQEKLFPDFKGTLKSLGAWGGDFILAVAKENPVHYFQDKGYTTIIPYPDMIL